MGKERYYYWSGKSSKRSESGKAKDNNIIINNNNNSNSSSGCMSAVFQFFDFHPFHFGIHNHQNSFKFNGSFPQEQEPSKVLKGAEAPRNSLELEEASFSSFDKDNDNLAIPIGIQIKTRGDRRTKSSQEIISSSPGGAKTPTLVARLMGLDLLPETSSTLSSPRPSSTLETPPPLVLSRSQPPRQPRTTTGRKSCSDTERGTRSLPETPRISLGRRSDVDLHHRHRLSLQINKENMNSAEDLELTRYRSKSFRNDMENSRSPSYYAKQIVQQVKENVSRRVGLDVTNTAKNTEQPGNTQVVNSKRPSKTCSRILEEPSPGKHETTSSYSPRTRFGESIQKNQKQAKPPCPALHILHDNQIERSKILPKPKSQVVVEGNHKNQEKSRSVQKCRKVPVDERFKRPTQKPDFIKNYKQEEPFVRPMSQGTRVSKISEKTCRKSPVPTLLPVKKDPSPPVTKIPSKQPQQQVLVLVDDPYPSKHHGTKLSNCSSQRYHHQHQQQGVTHMILKHRDTPNDATTTSTVAGGELQYISSILKCTGIDKHTQLFLFTKCFSPTHPLDPSIFNQVENSLSNFSISSSDGDNMILAGPLGLKYNRKLIFDLMDEILIDILKPHIRLKPWLVSIFELQCQEYRIYNGSHLVDTLCTRIKRFPCANCQVLEDIDALVDLDIEPMKHYQITRPFKEVGDFLATEIERDILNALIQETIIICGIGK